MNSPVSAFGASPHGSSNSVLVVGLSFRSAPVALLEKVAVAEADVAKLQMALVETDVLSEAMVLSTCNRMEFYTVASAFHQGLDHIVATIAEHSGVPAQELEPHLYVHYSAAAAEHMLNVASGLDSLVVGEQQIIGQLRTAYTAADDHGTVGRTLHDLAQRALHTGKRVHTETEIDSAGASMVSFAVDTALQYLDVSAGEWPLEGRRALIVGAGAMASLASTYLGKLGISHVTVANRTVERAENLAQHAREAGVAADAVGLDAIGTALRDVDLVVTATGAVGNVVTTANVEAALPHRADRPLVLCDLSMPRDIEQSVADLPHCTLLNIEELTALSGTEVEDEDAAREIVAEELGDFLEQQRAQAIVPTLKVMRQRAADMVNDELLQLERHTPTMSDEDRAHVERTVHRIVEKLLHTPTVQAKRLSAEQDQVSFADALAALFNVPQGAVESVTEPKGGLS